ncbi:MAG: class I SAM-dependent methyltransferase [Pirellulales bacterium]
MAVVTPSHSQRDPASFRDPAGFVFRRQGRVFRAIDAECRQTLGDLFDRGLAARLIERRWLVRTDIVSEPALLAELRGEHPRHRDFLEHAAIEPISYPYEWSSTMLADAALLTLDLQTELLADGFCLKDASAYNVQFMHGRPAFIDWPSIVRDQRQSVWPALGQFLPMFLYPLLMHHMRGWDLRSCFLGAPAGRSLEQVAAALSWAALCRPSLWLDVTLPLLLGHWAESRPNASFAQTPQAKQENTNDSSAGQRLLLGRLRRKIERLAAKAKPRGAWHRYGDSNGYAETADKAKQHFVAEALTKLSPRRVLDLGCNTGEFSYLAAGCGAEVIAADADHDSVDALYRRLRQTPADITPLVVDLTNPSPGMGYRNCERPPFASRGQADCVLALALVHHLHVRGNLSWQAIRDQLAELTTDVLIVEHIPPDDPMFRRLIRFRDPPREEGSLAHFRAVFRQRLRFIREQRLPDSLRTMLLFRREE